GSGPHTARVRPAAGRGLVEPSFFDTFASGFVVGNPNLRPERSTSFEAGLGQDLTGPVTLSVTGFAQRFRDMIQFTSVPITPNGPNYFNIAAANASGIEAGASLRRLGPVTGGVAHTWGHTKVTD